MDLPVLCWLQMMAIITLFIYYKLNEMNKETQKKRE